MVNLIPESHRYLLDDPVYVVATTVMPDGQPQSTPVWFNREGDCLLINTMAGKPMATPMPRKPARNVKVSWDLNRCRRDFR